MKKGLESIEDIYPLSPLQEMMWFQTLYAPDSGVYLEQVVFAFDGAVDAALLRRAWEHTLKVHPVLRTAIFWEDLRQPVQVVQRQVELPWEEPDLTRLSRLEAERAIQTYLGEDSRRGFKLSQAPLMRIAWFRLPGGAQRCIWTFHHIVLDGWSVQILVKGLSEFYDCVRRNVALPLVPPRPYSDYIRWLQTQDTAAATSFWRDLLTGLTAPTVISTRSSPTETPAAAATFSEDHVLVSAATTMKLKEFARRHRVTLNTIVQGAWGLLLSRYSGNRDVLFGAVVSGRPAELPGVEAMIGMFINTLPVRTSLPPDAEVIQYLQQLQAQQLSARRFEFSRLVDIQEASAIPRGTPLFESVLVFENFPTTTSWEDQKNQQKEAGLLERTNLPLTVMVVPASEILIKVLYDCTRFDDAGIKRLLGHLRTILEGFAANPQRSLASVPIVTARERRQLLEDWNDTQRAFPLDSIVRLFDAQCDRTPNAAAFCCASQTISYSELNAQANRLARHLQSLQAGRDVLVGLYVERSIDFVVALLAVFKAGAAYVPLDPSYPLERLQFMLEDAGVTVVVSSGPLPAALQRPGMQAVRLDADAGILGGYPANNVAATASPRDLAYVIYTSGSTGKPKGAAVEHAQILNRLHWMWERYPFAPGEVGCQKTAVSFVDSIWELFGPLLKGIPCVIIPDQVLRDLGRFVEELGRNRITRLWLVPSLLNALLDLRPDLSACLPDLKFWVTSGEALSPALAQLFASQMPGATLYNLYGTSEIWDATWFDPRHEAVAADRAPIGRPIANMQAYVLDNAMQPVPVGVIGQLHVGGIGLARGYLNRPELTAEKFVPDPFSHRPGSRLYRTGDLARHLPDGNIEFLGRSDFQVKFRGYRVELGEVEAVLALHPDIKRVAVVAKGDASGSVQSLIAYVVPHALPGPEAEAMQGFVKARLPDHMVPSFFVPLEQLPLTPSGKLDRARLPDAQIGSRRDGRTLVLPRNDAERALAGIWSEVLGRPEDQIGVCDNFFVDLGGHSLLATQLVSRVRSSLHVEVPLRLFFEAPTIEALAREVGVAVEGERTSSPNVIKRLDRTRT